MGDDLWHNKPSGRLFAPPQHRSARVRVECHQVNAIAARGARAQEDAHPQMIGWQRGGWFAPDQRPQSLPARWCAGGLCADEIGFDPVTRPTRRGQSAMPLLVCAGCAATGLTNRSAAAVATDPPPLNTSTAQTTAFRRNQPTSGKGTPWIMSAASRFPPAEPDTRSQWVGSRR